MTRFRFALRACAALVQATALAACHPGARPAAALRLPPVARLQHDLDAILAAPPLEHGLWGVLVKSLATDQTLYSLNARKLLMPASNMKIVTLAAAAERLGWSYRYETRLFGSGPVDAGTLHGDLVVAGSGDPSIGGRDGPAARVFEEWADELKALGVHRIDGRIVGDDRAFDQERLGPGWTWDDLGEGYSAGVSALQFNENAVRTIITPGARPGARAIVTLEPDGSGLIVQNGIETVDAGTDAAAITARRLPGSDRLELGGVVSAGHAPLARTVSVDNPTRFFVTALRGTLSARGLIVDGPAADSTALRPGPAGGQTLLLTHSSPPLSALAATLMKASQNLYGETLLKTLGAAAGDSTAESGRLAVVSVVQAWGVEPGGLIMRDGSGLSRYNYVTPETLVTILTHVDRDGSLREPFEAALPVAAQDGTLANRFSGTAAAGNARAKTGSLANVRALSGYLRTADNEPLVFSILANNFEAAASVIDQAADAMVVRLAEFSRH